MQQQQQCTILLYYKPVLCIFFYTDLIYKCDEDWLKKKQKNNCPLKSGTWLSHAGSLSPPLPPCSPPPRPPPRPFSRLSFSKGRDEEAEGRLSAWQPALPCGARRQTTSQEPRPSWQFSDYRESFSSPGWTLAVQINRVAALPPPGGRDYI